METLLYLCCGEGPWVDEIVFSIHSAWRAAGTTELPTAVVTDVPASFDFEKLGLRVLKVGPAEMDTWVRPFGRSDPVGLPHRRKILALERGLQELGGSVILVDSDTYFTATPSRLFERIKKGRSVLHMVEGNIGTMKEQTHRKLADLLAHKQLVDRGGRLIDFGPLPAMWNSGVVGLDAGDSGLLADVLHLTDEVYRRISIHTAEQFALGHVLGRHTRCAAASDIVYHYWLPYLRRPFRDRVARILSMHETLPPLERAARLWPHRPRPAASRRMKLKIKDVFQSVGLLKDRLRAQA